jgi:hypothetical protein
MVVPISHSVKPSMIAKTVKKRLTSNSDSDSVFPLAEKLVNQYAN